MRTVVLVHGAWHGPWCWASVLAGLDEAGVPVVAVELGLRDLHDDAEVVLDALRGVEADASRAVLVGHSYGGAVVTDAGGHPAVEHLVYLAAYAPDADEAVSSVRIEGAHDGELADAIEVRDDGTMVLDPDRVGDLLYADCDPVDVERARRLLRPQHVATFKQVPRVVAWHQRPATYVVCGADRAVPPALQRAMAARLPDPAVVELAGASHSPFLSRPGEVVELLAGLAAP